ncbi:MAG TPA: hypothetical protein VIR57_19215 [Chloroflexota bacterium]|jgi:hypothetical protein
MIEDELTCLNCGAFLYDNVVMVREAPPGEMTFACLPPGTTLCGSCLEPVAQGDSLNTFHGPVHPKAEAR